MARIRFALRTPLAPAAVIARLTDFGPARAEVWPNIDSEHFQVHGQGPGWTEVTEGSAVAGGFWERERYTWDVEAGRITVETLDSNTWGPGSGWDYQLAPTPGGGTEITVTVARKGIGWKGRLIEMGLVIGGARVLRSQLRRVLA